MKKTFAATALLFFALCFAKNLFSQDSDEVPPLTLAIWKGDAILVADLISKGANVNVSRSETPLLEAIDSGNCNIEIVKLLLGAKGIDVNKLGSRGLGSYTWTRTALHAAAQRNNVEAVRLLLEKGAKPDVKDYTDPAPTLWGPGPLDTPLLIAADNQNLEIITLLLDKGANVNYHNDQGEFPLFRAATAPQKGVSDEEVVNVVRLLLDRGAIVDAVSMPPKPHYMKVDLPPGTPASVKDTFIDNGSLSSALTHNAVSGLVEVAGLLLDRGANIELKEQSGHTALFVATANNHTKMMSFLLDRGANIEFVDPAGTSCLLLASSSMLFDAVNILIKRGANVNAVKALPNALMYAINQGRPDKERDSLKMMKILIDAGININYQNAQGVSPLMTACGWGVVPKSPARAKLLLDKGANVNLADNQGQTALMFAAFRGYLDIAKMLLDKGADVNAKNSVGRTALMIASTATNDLQGTNGDFNKMVKLLLDRGADVNIQDKDKNNALSLATRYKRTETIALLTAKGATLNGAPLPPDESKAILGTWEGSRNSNPYATYRFTFNSDKTYTVSAFASAAMKKEFPDQAQGMTDSLKSQTAMEIGTGGSFSFREQWLVLETNSIFAPKKVMGWQVVDGKLKLNGGEFILSKVTTK